MTEPVGSGFILAGGQSSRMGTDKALTLFAGRPLIQIALETLTTAGVSARIAGSRSLLSAFGEEVPDIIPGQGPLSGVHAALTASTSEWNLFLPIDLPLMPASLLGCLLQRALLTGSPVTVGRLNGRVQPFPVVLNRTVLPSIAQRLEDGHSACHAAWQSIPTELGSALDAVPIEYLHQCGQCRHPRGLPPALWFVSANTPVELARLNRLGV